MAVDVLRLPSLCCWGDNACICSDSPGSTVRISRNLQVGWGASCPGAWLSPPAEPGLGREVLLHRRAHPLENDHKRTARHPVRKRLQLQRKRIVFFDQGDRLWQLVFPFDGKFLHIDSITHCLPISLCLLPRPKFSKNTGASETSDNQSLCRATEVCFDTQIVTQR